MKLLSEIAHALAGINSNTFKRKTCVCCNQPIRASDIKYAECVVCKATYHPWCHGHDCHPTEQEVEKALWKMEERQQRIERNLLIAATTFAFTMWFLDDK